MSLNFIDKGIIKNYMLMIVEYCGGGVGYIFWYIEEICSPLKWPSTADISRSRWAPVNGAGIIVRDWWWINNGISNRTAPIISFIFSLIKINPQLFSHSRKSFEKNSRERIDRFKSLAMKTSDESWPEWPRWIYWQSRGKESLKSELINANKMMRERRDWPPSPQYRTY